MENKSIWALRWDSFLKAYTFEEIEIIEETEKTYRLKSNKCRIKHLNKRFLYLFISDNIFGFDKESLIERAINRKSDEAKHYQQVADECKESVKTLLELKSEEQDDESQSGR